MPPVVCAHARALTDDAARPYALLHFLGDAISNERVAHGLIAPKSHCNQYRHNDKYKAEVSAGNAIRSAVNQTSTALNLATLAPLARADTTSTKQRRR